MLPRPADLTACTTIGNARACSCSHTCDHAYLGPSAPGTRAPESSLESASESAPEILEPDESVQGRVCSAAPALQLSYVGMAINRLVEKYVEIKW